MPRRTLELVSFALITILTLSSFQVYAWEKEGEGTVTVSTVSAGINSYNPNDPNNPVKVVVGSSTSISVTFTNTGNTAWKFLATAIIYDSNGNVVVYYEKTLDTALQPNQQTTVSWTHTVSNAGDYWLQFGVYKEKFTEADRLDRKPSPSQKLIIGITTTSPTVGSFSITIPQSGSGTTSFSVNNPNDVSITIKQFRITDYGGFGGTFTVNGNLVSGTNPVSLDINVPAKGSVTLGVIVAAGSSSSGTYTIKFKLSGTP